MGKFNLSTKGGQLSEIEKRAQVALPTQEVEQAAPESPPSASLPILTLSVLVLGLLIFQLSTAGF